MKRFYIIPIVLAAALASIYVLPKRGTVAPTSLSPTELNMNEESPPLFFGEWSGRKEIASKKERAILAKDTHFIKGSYSCLDLPTINGHDGKTYENAINLSIVISGHDINNSIHRPERCLTAQGHQSLLSLPDQITTPNGRDLKVQKITSHIPVTPLADGTTPAPFGFVSYYYFVGHKRITHSHLQRTLIDMQDRLTSGTDQQWSFIMVSAPYNTNADQTIQKQQQENIDKKIRQFFAELTDRIVDWEQFPAN